jgi:UDP-2-acetamido-2,6-beta-L-arabino-hexul-4-ose reductase
MLKVGITGQNGFIGQHLYNTLGLFNNEFERIDFNKTFFDSSEKLDSFIKKCNVIVHLAAMNRHGDPQVIYNTNISLVNKLIASLERTKSKAHIFFSSSSQEDRDNPYGKSKKDGRELLVNWVKTQGGKLTGLIIPNVFGPFGHPYYNSVVATFCHQLTHHETPKIDIDGVVKLIYVGDLINLIISEIRKDTGHDALTIKHTHECKVSEILSILELYKSQYLENGIIPILNSKFELDLFNTFRCYMDIERHFPVKFIKHSDQRGAFVEIIRLNIGGQISFSTTVPGITRGNHFHTRKIERFAVIKGAAVIQLRQIGADKVMEFYLSGDQPAFVDMPVWFTHNIKNIGEDELYTIFWINEFYDPNDSDTYFENV